MARRPVPEHVLPGSHVERFGPGPVPPRARLRPHEVEEWLARTRSPDPALRQRAIQALCPCHVRGDERGMWDRILEMSDDPDVAVRRAAFHALTDGSPRSRASDVVAAIERMRQDPDRRLRRAVRRFLAQHRRTGRVNVN